MCIFTYIQTWTVGFVLVKKLRTVTLIASRHIPRQYLRYVLKSALGACVNLPDKTEDTLHLGATGIPDAVSETPTFFAEDNDLQNDDAVI